MQAERVGGRQGGGRGWMVVPDQEGFGHWLWGLDFNQRC